MTDLPPLDPWQYRLGEAPAPTPGARAVGPLWLETGPDLPVCQVTDSTGAPAGVLLGFPIDLEARRLLGAQWRLPFPCGAAPEAFAARVLDRLGGRFAWILQGPGGVLRLYPDCSAQVPCVFDSAARRAGSTAHALLDEATYEARFDRALFDLLGVDGEGWFPAGLTAHEGIARLLPNHYLDLTDWRVRRFWRGPEGPAPDPEAIVDGIADAVQAQIEALVAGPRKVALALTAGRDTRLLLACARDRVAEIDVLTVTGGDRRETDTVVARRIAHELGLAHIILPRVRATPEQRARFLRRGGHCNGDSNSADHPSVWPIADSHVMIGGLGGEVAGAFLWRADDRPETPIPAERLMRRLGLPPEPRVHAALEAWLAELDGVDTLTLLDLAYNENRNGPWFAAQFYSDPTLLRLAPMMTRRVFALMAALPEDWKRQRRLSDAVIARLWPELARYPYNSQGRMRDLALTAARVMRNPKTIAKKLRKING